MCPYDWIVFDSTGTLMKPDPDAASTYCALGRRFGCRQSVDEVRVHLSSAMKRHFFSATALDPTDESTELERWRRIVRDTLSDLEESAFDDAFNAIWQHFALPEAWRLYDDVLPTIGRLRERGFKIAVASNFDGRLRRVMAGKQILNHFDRLLISSEIGWSKPNPRFYDVATERIKSNQRSRLLMVGDTQRGDVDAARQSGWKARLLVREHEQSLAELLSDLL